MSFVLGRPAYQLLIRLANGHFKHASNLTPDSVDVRLLISSDLAETVAGRLQITSTGRAHLARATLKRQGTAVDPFLGQHMDLVSGSPSAGDTRTDATFDAAESPLVWLARRKGRDGLPIIAPHQLQAGERLRSEFTRGQLMPRTTSNWSAAVSDGHRGETASTFSDAVITSRQRLRRALDAVGPEFSGLLVDVCCFLKGLEDVERERSWPARSAKVVLQLALDRLARHYGFEPQANGRSRAKIQTWLAPDAEFRVGVDDV